jgi:hypothetical protein
MYWRPNRLEFGKREALLHVFYAPEMTEMFHRFAASGMLATDFDGCIGHWAAQGLNYYVCARLSWNPKLTYEEILDDYCRSGFGPAAEHVKRYFRLAEKTYVRDDPAKAMNLTPEILAGLRDALTQGNRAAGADETVRRRIAFLRMGLNWNALYAAITDLAQRADAKPPYDRQKAEGLMTLACHTLWDFTRHWPDAVNAPNMVGHSGNFVPWRSLGWGKFLEAMVRKAQEDANAQPPKAHAGRLTGRERTPSRR